MTYLIRPTNKNSFKKKSNREPEWPEKKIDLKKKFVPFTNVVACTLHRHASRINQTFGGKRAAPEIDSLVASFASQ